MITVEVKTKGNLQGFIGSLSSAIAKGVDDAVALTAKQARRNTYGRLRNNILIEHVENSPTSQAARVYNNTDALPWSSYVEFGTGIYVDNEGITEAIRLKVSKSIPWYVPDWRVPASFARYGYPHVYFGGRGYWEVEGMHPKPYMYPAAFSCRKKNVQAVADAIIESAKRTVV